MIQTPIHIACGQRHDGPVCPDGKVMCKICFIRVPIADLNLLDEGVHEDVCRSCARKEGIAQISKRGE